MAQATGFPLVEVGCKRFADGEIELDKSNLASVKDAYAIIICPFGQAVHDKYIWLMFVVHALTIAQVKKITVCMPYTPYTRQSEALQVILEILASLGVSQWITIQLHEPLPMLANTMMFADASLDAWIAQWARQHYQLGTVTIVAPDNGSLERALYIAKQLQAPLIACTKERYDSNKIRITQMSDICTTPYALIVDDIIDTGSTVVHIARILKDQPNIKAIDVFAVHGLFSGNALTVLQQSVLRNIVITNTIEHVTLPSKFEIVDISDYALSCLIKKLLA